MSRVRSFVQSCHSSADNSAAHSDDVLAHAGASAQAGAASDRIRMRLAQGNGDMSTSAIASAVRAEYPGIGMSGVVQEVRRIRGVMARPVCVVWILSSATTTTCGRQPFV